MFPADWRSHYPMLGAVVLRLANRTADGQAGRLDIYYAGEWGMVSS